MEIHLPFSTRQKAFRAGDDVADSVWFIQAVIKDHQDNLRPLNVAFVDVKKAFDSVSHQSLLVAPARLGVHPRAVQQRGNYPKDWLRRKQPYQGC